MKRKLGNKAWVVQSAFGLYHYGLKEICKTISFKTFIKKFHELIYKTKRPHCK